MPLPDENATNPLPLGQDIPQQQQQPPGDQEAMVPEPQDELQGYVPGKRLEGRVAIISGGDSGIGRAVAILFAKEGADISIVYLKEHGDAQATRLRVEQLGRRCVLIAGDVGDAAFCAYAVGETVSRLGSLGILVNNAAIQTERESISEVSEEELIKTFKTNFFGYIHLINAAKPHLAKGACIVNTTSVQAYDPRPKLLDYAATKAAIVNLTRSLAKELAPLGIRVNAVAPGPIWTPLIPSTVSPEGLANFGQDTLMKRPGQPAEVAPSFLFLASEWDSSYMTGQTLHPNGGRAFYS